MQCGAVNINKAKLLNPEAFIVAKPEKKQETIEQKYQSIYQKADVVVKSTDLDFI